MLCPLTKKLFHHNKFSAYAGASGGFSTAELNIVVLVIVILILIMLPGMLSLVSDARAANAIRDAAGIGAVIESLKLEGKFNPEDAAGLAREIYSASGVEYEGRFSEVQPDGSFIYKRVEGGVTYAVRYDSSTGSVGEVK